MAKRSSIPPSNTSRSANNDIIHTTNTNRISDYPRNLSSHVSTSSIGSDLQNLEHLKSLVRSSGLHPGKTRRGLLAQVASIQNSASNESSDIEIKPLIELSSDDDTSIRRTQSVCPRDSIEKSALNKPPFLTNDSRPHNFREKVINVSTFLRDSEVFENTSRTEVLTVQELRFHSKADPTEFVLPVNSIENGDITVHQSTSTIGYDNSSNTAFSETTNSILISGTGDNTSGTDISHRSIVSTHISGTSTPNTSGTHTINFSGEESDYNSNISSNTRKLTRIELRCCAVVDDSKRETTTFYAAWPILARKKSLVADVNGQSVMIPHSSKRVNPIVYSREQASTENDPPLIQERAVHEPPPWEGHLANAQRDAVDISSLCITTNTRSGSSGTNARTNRLSFSVNRHFADLTNLSDDSYENHNQNTDLPIRISYYVAVVLSTPALNDLSTKSKVDQIARNIMSTHYEESTARLTKLLGRVEIGRLKQLANSSSDDGDHGLTVKDVNTDDHNTPNDKRHPKRRRHTSPKSAKSVISIKSEDSVILVNTPKSGTSVKSAQCIGEKATDSLLTCPLTLGEIEIPARGQNCEHLQCFDLKSFVTWQLECEARYWQRKRDNTKNKKESAPLRPVPTCPVCKRFISFLPNNTANRLIIDRAFSDIVMQGLLSGKRKDDTTGSSETT